VNKGDVVRVWGGCVATDKRKVKLRGGKPPWKPFTKAGIPSENCGKTRYLLCSRDGAGSGRLRLLTNISMWGQEPKDFSRTGTEKAERKEKKKKYWRFPREECHRDYTNEFRKKHIEEDRKGGDLSGERTIYTKRKGN